MEERQDIEKLALFQALYNKIGKEVATTGNGLRAKVDQDYYDMYVETGCKSFDVRMFDEQVGTYSLRFSKPTHQEVKRELLVKDYCKMAKWLDESTESYEIDMLKQYIAQDLEAYAKWYFEHTGDCPPGTDFDTVVVPAQPKQYIGGVLKVDSQKVAEVCESHMLQGVSQLLLGDGYGTD